MQTAPVVQKLRRLPFNDGLPLILCNVLYACVYYGFGEARVSSAVRSMQVDSASTTLVLGTFAVYAGVYWCVSLVYFLMDHPLAATFAHLKIQAGAPLPSVSQYCKMVALVCFNQVVLSPAITYAFMLLWTVYGRVAPFALLAPWQMLAYCVTSVLSLEVWFYVMHRTLHCGALYVALHKEHHVYSAPVAVESVYVHPVEYVLNSYSCLLVGTTVWTVVLQQEVAFANLWVLTALITFLQVHDHSGYWLPLLPKVLMHDYHHSSPNTNYGILGIMDALCGTEGGYKKYEAALMMAKAE